VCEVLGLENPTKTVARLDEDERALTTIQGKNYERNVNIVNEFGLYNLILTSRKAEAKRFKRWVTHEVLPSIRKTGRYEARPQAEPSNQDGHTGVNVFIPEPGLFSVRVDSDGTAHVAAECRLDLNSDREDAHRRFHDLFRDGTIHPDFLLSTLFKRHCPWTYDNKHRFFFDDVCLATGIQDPDHALSLIPETHRALLTVRTFEGAQQRWAVTEESVYILAFIPKIKLLRENETLRQANKRLTQTIASLLLIYQQSNDPFSYRHADDPLYATLIESTINSAIELLQQTTTNASNGALF